MTEDTLAGGHVRVGEPADLEDDQQSSYWRKEDCQESERRWTKVRTVSPNIQNQRRR